METNSIIDDVFEDVNEGADVWLEVSGTSGGVLIDNHNHQYHENVGVTLSKDETRRLIKYLEYTLEKLEGKIK